MLSSILMVFKLGYDTCYRNNTFEGDEKIAFELGFEFGEQKRELESLKKSISNIESHFQTSERSEGYYNI